MFICFVWKDKKKVIFLCLCYFFCPNAGATCLDGGICHYIKLICSAMIRIEFRSYSEDTNNKICYCCALLSWGCWPVYASVNSSIAYHSQASVGHLLTFDSRGRDSQCIPGHLTSSCFRPQRIPAPFLTRN